MSIKQTISRIIKWFVPYGAIIFIRYIKSALNLDEQAVSSKKIFQQYYNNTPLLTGQNIGYNKTIIYMADGRIGAGGLTDRIRGLLSLYKIACNINVDFKINMSSPVDLANYLIPNKYNWIIDKDNIIYNIKHSVIREMYSDITLQPATQIIKQLFEKYNQLHITTNMDIATMEYGKLFNDLFKPTPELQALIDYNISAIDCQFISATFRFQNLLGDFYEGNFPVLPESDQIKLINRCIDHLKEIFDENSAGKILVTSDSLTFLNEAKKLDFVYVIPGEIAHIDYSLNLSRDVYMKSFVDYFLLTHAQKLYLIVDGDMYQSGFAYHASLHNSRYVIKRYY